MISFLSKISVNCDPIKAGLIKVTASSVFNVDKDPVNLLFKGRSCRWASRGRVPGMYVGLYFPKHKLIIKQIAFTTPRNGQFTRKWALYGSLDEGKDDGTLLSTVNNDQRLDSGGEFVLFDVENENPFKRFVIKMFDGETFAKEVKYKKAFEIDSIEVYFTRRM